MPSIIPSYIYTILGAMIVGTLVIGMVGLTSANIKQEAEKQQLSNIADCVAVKSLELSSHALVNNLSSTVNLELPSLIGGKSYYIMIANDSSNTWVDTGFGTPRPQGSTRTKIPLIAFASGTYISGSRCALLKCKALNEIVYLEIQGGQ